MTSRPWKYWEKDRVLFGEPMQHTGDPERDALITALLAIEHRQGERRGWDQKPRLYSVHLTDSDAGALIVRTIPARQWATGFGDITDQLVASADKLPDLPADLPHHSFADSPDGFCAVAFMAEAYSTHHRTGDLRERIRRGDQRALAEVEATALRMVTAVDINANTYLVQRKRDAEPTIHTETLAEARDRAAAAAVLPRLPAALARITVGILTANW